MPIRALLLVIALALVGESALAQRPPSPTESQAIEAAVRAANSHLDITIVSVSVSTVDAHFAKVKSEGALKDGTPIGPATTALRGSGSSWTVLDSGSDLGDCSQLSALGIPPRVVDDLGLSRTRCASVPLPRLATGLGSYTLKPATVRGWTPSNTGVLGAPRGAPNSSRSFGRIVWKSWGRVSASGLAGVWSNNCVPDCARGRWAIVHTTTVRASRPRSNHFTRLTFRLRGTTQSFTLNESRKIWE